MNGYYLLIDAGNTRIKWVRVEADGMRGKGFISSRSLMSPALDLAWAGLEKPLGIALSNVAGEPVEADIRAYIAHRWSMDICLARAMESACGVTSGYREPSRLGVDRWLALIAARARSHRPMVIVDAGSACTIDLMDSSGRHLGGYILPGLFMMTKALVKSTAQIHEAKSSVEGGLGPGADTADAISSGALLALAGAVERVLSPPLLPSGCSEPLLLLTGGDAERLATAIRHPAELASDLVFEGLWCFYKEARLTLV